MAVVVDLIILLIILFSAWRGYLNGFILSFFNLFGSLISFCLASFFAKPVGTILSNKFLEPTLSNYFAKKLSRIVSTPEMDGSINEKSSVFSDLLENFGYDKAEIHSLLSVFENDADAFASSVAQKLSHSISESISCFIALFLLFIAIFVLFKFLVKFFDLIAKLPLLNASNRILGLASGIIVGVLLSLVFSFLLLVFEPLIQSNDSAFLSSFSLDETLLANFLSKFFKFVF